MLVNNCLLNAVPTSCFPDRLVTICSKMSLSDLMGNPCSPFYAATKKMCSVGLRNFGFGNTDGEERMMVC